MDFGIVVLCSIVEEAGKQSDLNLAGNHLRLQLNIVIQFLDSISKVAAYLSRAGASGSGM